MLSGDYATIVTRSGHTRPITSSTRTCAACHTLFFPSTAYTRVAVARLSLDVSGQPLYYLIDEDHLRFAASLCAFPLGHHSGSTRITTLHLPIVFVREMRHRLGRLRKKSHGRLLT